MEHIRPVQNTLSLILSFRVTFQRAQSLNYKTTVAGNQRCQSVLEIKCAISFGAVGVYAQSGP